MAQFDESKVINALHPEKAEVGKKYWFSDSITLLKSNIEAGSGSGSGSGSVFVLKKIIYGNYPFIGKGSSRITQFLYPYEEPPKFEGVENV